MSGTATLPTEQAVLGHTLGFAAMPFPAAIYVSLCLASASPSSTQGGIEVAGSGYLRTPGTFALLTTPPNVAANNVTIEFPTATGSWGDIGYFEIWDRATQGNRLYWGTIVDPADGVTPIVRTVLFGDIMRFSAGVLQIKAT